MPHASRPPAIAAALALLCALSWPASSARAYDQRITLDPSIGWGVAPVFPMGLPDHGPVGSLGATLGFDDTWGLGVVGSWAVHPPLSAPAEIAQVGIFGAEALYYIDILEVVPFFGLGLDALLVHDGANFRADLAAHLRVSLDYLVSRDVAVGVDIRPYVLLTALDLNPVYLTFQVRLSVLLDY